ncbi:MAG: endonuclease [Bacteroidales bacterium]|jgi:predicted extracellular nuclease|nr:endonuclease [Bacteroidales bacterium]
MIRYAIFIFLTLFAFQLTAQTENESPERSFRYMFYNVENLFDTEDDPEKNDQEFLPNDGKFWNKYRYRDKLFKIYQVITAVGKWKSPEIIGLCEIENRKVLEDLISRTPLYNAGYKIIHFESPDSRGIDVGLLYRENAFEPLIQEKIPVHFSGNRRSTRDILYVKGVVYSVDTIHVYVNHWPSRWGGQLETEQKRMRAASVLRKHVDSVFHADKNPNIIISGDLNDYPDNKSLTENLRAHTENYDKARDELLYNLSYYMQFHKKQGSHKYHGEWGVLDQLIVSGNLLNQSQTLQTSLNHANVFAEDFLLEDDEKYTGKIPNRTYIGYKYNGGFSDHLPVYIDFFSNEKQAD